MKPNITKIAVATLSAIALTSQLAAVPQTAVKAESDFAEVVTVMEAAVAQDFTQDKYTQSQVEFLISQIVAKNSETDDCENVSYTYSDLYYSPSEKAGYVIDFTYGDSCGYIIMLVDDESARPAEIALDRQSPYYGKAGTYMYPSAGYHYILADNGNIVEALQYTEMSDKPQNVAMMNVNNLGGYTTEAYFSYPYVTAELYEEYEMLNIITTYRSDTPAFQDKNNTCANVAGVIALNYWNMYYNNAILKLKESEIRSSGYEKGSMQQDVAEEYMNIFYKYMKTNNWLGDVNKSLGDWLDKNAPDLIGGTLPKYCYEGFEQLIKEKGYQTTRLYTSTYENIKDAIYNDVPVFITSLNYCFGDAYYNDENTNLIFNGHRYIGLTTAHTFIGYGYKEYILYDKNGKQTIKKFLTVADNGFGNSDFYLAESEILSAAAIVVFRPKVSRC